MSIDYYINSLNREMSSIKSNLDAIKTEHDKSIKQIEDLTAKQKQQFGQIKKTLLSNVVLDFTNTNLDSAYRSYGSIEAADARLEESWKKAQQIHEENHDALQSNQKLYYELVNMLKTIGLPPEEKYRKSTRSRYDSYRPAAWIGMLGNFIPIDDKFKDAETVYTYSKHVVKTWKKEVEQRNSLTDAKTRELTQQLEQERQEKEAYKEQLRKSMFYTIKLGLEDGATPDAMLTKLIQLDKYLKLSVYINLGVIKDIMDSKYAEKGLEGFKIQGGNDSDVYSRIKANIKSIQDGSSDATSFDIPELDKNIEPRVKTIWDKFKQDYALELPNILDTFVLE